MTKVNAVNDDTQIAILASLLEPATYPLSELSEALKDCKGDVAAAAEALLLPRVKSAGKRKAGTSLQSWLGKKRDAKPSVAASPVRRTSLKDQPKDGLPPPNQEVVAKPEGSKPDLDPSLAEPSYRESKATKNAFTLLKPAPSSPSKRKAAPMPAVPLATQSAIDAHTLPLTLLKSPLSPALASALFLAMMDESESWDRHRWFLAGRWVESPHTSANYYRLGGGYGATLHTEDGMHVESPPGEGSRDGSSVGRSRAGGQEGGQDQEGKYYYSGNELFPPKPYPELLRLAAEQIEPVVNASLRSKARHPLEWAGEWQANVCGANRYDGAASGVGWHADQLTYLGPAATICSLSLGTTRAFRVRQTEAVDPNPNPNPNSNPRNGAHGSPPSVSGPGPPGKPIRTYEVNLAHNSLVLMNAGCQERFKHTIPPQKALDLFRPAYDVMQRPIPMFEQQTYTARINITFRFYRSDFHPSPVDGWKGIRVGTPLCKCGIPTLLRADQKAKARANLSKASVNLRGEDDGMLEENVRAATAWLKRHERSYDFPLALTRTSVRPDDMVYFWQCQSPGNTGELKGCGFFRILDMRAEGRGPCWGDVVTS